MSRIRTFIAIDISSDVRDRARGVIDSLASETSSVRWVEPRNIHLTLKFLGDVDDTVIYDVCRATSAVVAQRRPFQVECRGMGAFPRIDRPRTIWLGIDDQDEQLSLIHRELDRALLKLGFPGDARRFNPHLTVGRIRQGHRKLGNLVSQLKSNSAIDFGPIDVSELLVYSSDLTPSGPIYTILGRSQMGG